MKRSLLLAIVTAILAAGRSSSHGPGMVDAVQAPVGRMSEGAQPRLSMRTELTLASERPDSLFHDVARVAREHDGHLVHAEGERITVRIPATSYEPALAALESLGEVLRKEVTGQDVSEEYRDLEIRLDSAQRSRERYLELLARAETVPDALAIERELERLDSLIEQMKGRRLRLEHLVAYATFTVEAGRARRPGPIGAIAATAWKGLSWLFVRG